MTIVHHVRPRLARTNTPALIEALGPDEFEGYASLFNVADGAGDIVAPGAFTRSLRRRPPSRVRMLYQHFAHEPIGVWEQIREDARGLYVRGRLIADVPRAADVARLIREGALDGLSIGFRALRARRDPKSGTRTLLEVELWEISIVTFPLLSGSEVTGIGKKNGLAQGLRKASIVLRAAHFPPPFTGEVSADARSASGGGRRGERRENSPLRLARKCSLSTSPAGGGGK
jgi:uncharacterized protein